MRSVIQQRRNRCFTGWSRRVAVWCGVGGWLPLLAGCVVLSGFAAGAAVFLLTGVFLGSIQASFAATARSYEFTDTGPVQFVFNQPRERDASLVRLIGRLPGFYVVIVDDDLGKVVPRAQDQESPLFTTDVDIDFSTVPPTITGTIREVDGDQEFALEELFPSFESVAVETVQGRQDNEYEVRLTIVAQGPGGEELEYSLVLSISLTASGAFVDGEVDVERVWRAPDGEDVVIEGNGSVATVKQTADTLPESDASDDNRNDNQAAEDEGEEPGPGPGPESEDSAEAGDEPEDGAEGGEGDESDEDGSEAPEEEEEEPEPSPPVASCLAGLPPLAQQAVDDLLAPLGREALDLDGDGTVSAAEVLQSVNPTLAPFGLELPAQTAACIASAVNG